MQILHVTHQYPPDYVGGVELYTQTVARAQSALGHGVAIFTHDGAASAAEHAQPQWHEGAIAVQAVQSTPVSATRRFLATFGDSAATATFEGLLESFQPTVVHIQHLMGLPTALVQQLQQRGIPYLITLHDYWWVCANAQLLTNDSARVCGGPDALWFNCTRCAMARAGLPRPSAAAALTAPLAGPIMAQRTARLRRILQQAAHLITPTHFVANWYQTHGAPADRLTVLPLGVEKPSTASKVAGSPKERVRFTYIGGLTWQKGIHVLLKAFQGVEGAAELWIGGDLTVDPAYATLLKDLAGPNVRFLGKLDRQQVWESLAQTDMVVAPSIWYESFSLLAHEAFAAGVPVLASRLGALAEVVHDEVDGKLAPPGDVSAWRAAIQQIVDNPQQLVHLRQGIRAPLTVEQHVSQLMQIYAAVGAGKTKA